MRPIFTKKYITTHNNVTPNQNNATKTFQGFNGLKLFLPDHCVKSVQIRSFFWSAYRKYGPEKTPCLDTFHAVDGANASKMKLVCSFHVSKILSLESTIKELFTPILVSSKFFDDPSLLPSMSSHSMILCGAISRLGIFTSPSFDSNSLRGLI